MARKSSGYTWTVKRRRDTDAPWLVETMRTETSSLDMHLYKDAVADSLSDRWDFADPNIALTVYRW